MQSTTLVTGPVGKSLLRFVLPILAGNLLQQLYNSIDAMIIGRYVGESALGAIGVSQPIFTIMIALLMGMGIGLEILLGRYIGSRDPKGIKQVLDTLFTSVMLMSVFLAAAGYFAAPGLLRLINTPAEQIEDAAAYLRIIFLGIPGMAGYNTMSGAIRSSGNSKVPLLFLAVCAVLNAALDIWMVKGLGMGVEGAALATILSQTVSFLLCLYYLNHCSVGMRYDPRRLDLSAGMLKQGLMCAIPASIQQCAMSVGMLLLQMVVNGLGAQAVTAYTIGSRIDSFAGVPITNIGQALSIFTSQNLGAGQPERVKEAKRHCLTWSYVIGGVLLVLLWGFGGHMARFFGAAGETVRMTEDYVRVLSLGYFVAGYFTVVQGLIRGTGNTFVPMVITIAGYWLIRLPAAVLLQRPLGPLGVWLSILVGWVFAYITTLLYYHSRTFQRSLNTWKIGEEKAL